MNDEEEAEECCDGKRKVSVVFCRGLRLKEEENALSFASERAYPSRPSAGTTITQCVWGFRGFWGILAAA